MVDELRSAQRRMRIAVVTETCAAEVHGASLSIAQVVEGSALLHAVPRAG